MNLARMAALFLSKSGAVIVGMLFLPIYHSQLGNQSFGVVAIILSIQAFALMVDFGMSALVARDMAQLEPGMQPRVWQHAEAAIAMIYGAFLLTALVGCVAAGFSGDRTALVIGSILLVLFTVLQNLGQSALLATQHFFSASATQATGVVVRALATALALGYWSASLLTFVCVQATFTFLHFFVTRRLGFKLLSAALTEPPGFLTWPAITALLRRGRPLLVSGLAGAAVLQIDKPLISAFVAPADLSPYFLAMSFSVLPTSLLAAPVVQYFQPQVIRLQDMPESANSERTIGQFTLALIMVVALPSWVLWQWTEPVISLWLRDSAQADIVSSYVRILLPAFTLGSICYVPVVLLLAAQDFKYQAITSVLMTIGTLGLVFTFACYKRIDWVCYAYLVYFMTASASVWGRSLWLPATRHLAGISATKSVFPLSLLIMAAVVLSSHS